MVNFESTIVLHCQLTPSPEKKETGLFKTLAAKLFSFRPETCTRQIFILCNLSVTEQELLHQIVQQISPKLDECEIITNYNTYEFLLRWIVGLMSTKYDQNDRFVLGRVRKCWTEFCQIEAERLKGHNLLQIIPTLLGDAHSIRNKIETQFKSMLQEERISAVEDLCKQYRNAREQHMSPQLGDLPHLWSQNTALPSRTIMDKELQRTSKKLISLQTQIADIGDSVTPCPSPKHPEYQQQMAMLAKTKMSISAAWEKRRLEQRLSLEQSNEPTASINIF